MWKATGVTLKNGRIVYTRFETDDESDDEGDEDYYDGDDKKQLDVGDKTAAADKDDAKLDETDNKNSSGKEESVSSSDKTEQVKKLARFEKELAQVSLSADRVALFYLGFSFIPLVVGFSGFTLIMHKHLSWYSWLLTTLTTCVYTGGFVLMCPQLFINHKLKSVAHLPWKLLCFRFVNTFIDGNKFCASLFFAYSRIKSTFVCIIYYQC